MLPRERRERRELRSMRRRLHHIHPSQLFLLQSTNGMPQIYPCSALHSSYLPNVYICPCDLPSSHQFSSTWERLPGKLTASFRRLQELVESTLHVDFKSLRERERARQAGSLCLYFWPSEFSGIGAVAMASDDDVDDVKIPVSLLLNRLECFAVACGSVVMSRRESKYMPSDRC